MSYPGWSTTTADLLAVSTAKFAHGRVQPCRGIGHYLPVTRSSRVTDGVDHDRVALCGVHLNPGEDAWFDGHGLPLCQNCVAATVLYAHRIRFVTEWLRDRVAVQTPIHEKVRHTGRREPCFACGHDRSDANTYRNGARAYCRTCDRDRVKKFRERQRKVVAA